jgi:hypothetical protein
MILLQKDIHQNRENYPATGKQPTVLRISSEKEIVDNGLWVAESDSKINNYD